MLHCDGNHLLKKGLPCRLVQTQLSMQDADQQRRPTSANRDKKYRRCQPCHYYSLCFLPASQWYPTYQYFHRQTLFELNEPGADVSAWSLRFYTYHECPAQRICNPPLPYQRNCLLYTSPSPRDS